MKTQRIYFTQKETKTNHIWFERWLDLSLLQFRPIDRAEERVLSNVKSCATNVAEAEGDVSLQKLKRIQDMMENDGSLLWQAEMLNTFKFKLKSYAKVSKSNFNRLNNSPIKVWNSNSLDNSLSDDCLSMKLSVTESQSPFLFLF